MSRAAESRAAFQADPTDPRHGSLNGYTNLRCRCPRCTEANRANHAAYMASHPEQWGKQADRVERHRIAKRERRRQFTAAVLAAAPQPVDAIKPARRPGPVPGTTGRSTAEIARVCIDAYANGRNMGQAVADEYGISIHAAQAAVSRARRTGHAIPYDYGYSVDGVWQQHGGINPAWTAAVTHARQVAADRGDERAKPKTARPATPRPQRKFTPPRPTGRPHVCDDCGHTAPTGWELAAHTLDTHGRTLTATERTPITRNEENAA